MRPAPLGCAWRSPTPIGSRTPPSCLGGEGKGGGERGKGAPPPFLLLFGLGGEGTCGLPWLALLFSLMAHVGPLTPRGGGFQ